MKTKFNYLVLFLFTLTLISCTPENEILNEILETEVFGCTDQASLNYDLLANTDDGSCDYSRMTFFARYNFYQGVPIIQIDISVNGDYIGSISDGFIWPNGPGNCSSSGTVSYKFLNGVAIEWNATMHLASGHVISSSGTRSPDSSSECIKTNVTG